LGVAAVSVLVVARDSGGGAEVSRHGRSRRRNRGIADTNPNVSLVWAVDDACALGPAEADGAYLQRPPNSGLGSSIVAHGPGDSVMGGPDSCIDAAPDPGTFARGLEAELEMLVAEANQRLPSEIAGGKGDRRTSRMNGRRTVVSPMGRGQAVDAGS
jgi:hypothetical protein